MAETIKKMSSILLPTVLAIFTAVALITSLPCVSADKCGKHAAKAVCGGGWCCSQYGWCGVTHEYCGKGCQSQCGKLVATIITEDIFNQMLSHRNDRKCHANGFYTYAAFLAAASAFPGFGSTGDINTNRRELAAFLAQTSYETTAPWLSSPNDPYDHPYAWGYCFKEEQGITNDSCAPSSRWPCVSGKKYYGRGPIQITWNYNYGAAGKAIGFDGLNNPDIVANDSTVSFKTAVWFWMTAQSPNPSCHDVMTGSSDSLAGRPAGYGLVTNIISHGIECGKGSDSRQEKRIGFYKRYCDVLGVSYGSNIDCNSHTTNTMKNLTAPPGNLTVPSTNSTAPSRNLTRSSGKTSSKIVPILLGSAGGIGLIAVLCLVFSPGRHWKNCVRTDANLAAREDFGQVLFDYKVLRDSTGNFDKKNMLGKGGFGEVYKGRLPDGRVVAVKKMNGNQTSQAGEEFLREVRLITSVRHRNLVRLLGCCTRGHKRLLVYEFMSNNSLDRHLFGEIRNGLRWENRLNIIVGTARGLAYLHGDSNVRIIHRDIKCANILLDDRFHPKIADFGLAKFFPEGQTHVSTRVGGTIGYTAPEYAVHGQLTEKADVYSYGIVVLEIVSGRKCVDARLPAPLQLLLEWVWNLFQQDQVLDIVDLSLDGQYPREQVLRVINIALLCTQGSWALRPAMSEVVSMLTDSSEIIAEPTRPAYIDAPADRPANITPILDSGTSAAAPSQRSHGSISISLLPR